MVNIIINDFFKELCNNKKEAYFFKGTVPGPCPAPFRASVTRQATILYAESSSETLKKSRYEQSVSCFKIRDINYKNTFFLFPSLSLIADFDRAYAKNNSDYEKEDSSDYAGGYGFVFDARRYRILYLIAHTGAVSRIGDHQKVISSTANQIFHWKISIILHIRFFG